MALKDVFKTAIQTHNGHFEFLVMFFGLSNTPVTSQSLMNNIFRQHLKRLVLEFFNDILIYSKSMKEHIEHLKMMFALLELHTLVAKENKCVFGSNKWHT